MNVMPTIPQLHQKHDIAFSLWVAGQDEGKLVVTAFEAEERLNGLTRVDVALTSADAGIDLTEIIDRPATLTIHSKYDASPRHFSGVVAAVSRGDTGHHRTAYQLTILPPVSRLAHISDARIFQDLTVPEIVRKLLAEHGIGEVRWDVDAKLHRKREYCVMYRETLLSFIERICAEEGIWTHYVHEEKGRNTIVFLDDATVTPWCEHQQELEYNAMASGAVIRLSAPGGYITINKKGIKLYALKIEIEGNSINFNQGGPGQGCLKKMSQSSTPFVRM
jgi:type VI secretion system secreted protein VgrG